MLHPAPPLLRGEDAALASKEGWCWGHRNFIRSVRLPGGWGLPKEPCIIGWQREKFPLLRMSGVCICLGRSDPGGRTHPRCGRNFLHIGGERSQCGGPEERPPFPLPSRPAPGRLQRHAVAVGKSRRHRKHQDRGRGAALCGRRSPSCGRQPSELPAATQEGRRIRRRAHPRCACPPKPWRRRRSSHIGGERS